MKAYYLSVLLLLLVLVNACTTSEKKRNEEKISVTETALSNIDRLNDRAENDSNFKKSKEYAMQMEKYHIEISKMRNDINDVDKLLLEYEIGLKGLKKYTDRCKKDPTILKDKAFLVSFQSKGNKVKDCSQSLKRLNLNAEQTERFNRLSKQ